MYRELNKCHAGFAAVGKVCDNNTTVATGAWGCGAFGGDKEVKFGKLCSSKFFMKSKSYIYILLLAIQLAAASFNGCHLR